MTTRSEQTTVFRRARIHTMDPRRPRAEAMAARGGRLLAVGAEAEVAAVAGRDARVVDLGGRTVVPGFVESHCHFLTTGLTLRQVDARTPPNGTIADLIARVREFARAVPAGDWILGWGYDDTLIGDARALSATTSTARRRITRSTSATCPAISATRTARRSRARASGAARRRRTAATWCSTRTAIPPASCTSGPRRRW